MSRGVWRIFAVALQQYQHTLEAHALLDFSGVLERAVQLLKDMDEFAESRLRLEARHRHVLVDEFQDTSRAQWELVRQLVKSWGEGFRRGRRCDPAVDLHRRRPQAVDLRVPRRRRRDGRRGRRRSSTRCGPDGSPRQAITVSFRSAPGILAFVNDVFAAIVDGEAASAAARRDAFRYGERDRFPIGPTHGSAPTDRTLGGTADRRRGGPACPA